MPAVSVSSDVITLVRFKIGAHNYFERFFTIFNCIHLTISRFHDITISKSETLMSCLIRLVSENGPVSYFSWLLGNTYIACPTVVFDGPFTTRFLKPPANVKLPLPRDTDIDSRINGSKCSMPNSGMPTLKEQIILCF